MSVFVQFYFKQKCSTPAVLGVIGHNVWICAVWLKKIRLDANNKCSTLQHLESLLFFNFCNSFLYFPSVVIELVYLKPSQKVSVHYSGTHRTAAGDIFDFEPSQVQRALALVAGLQPVLDFLVDLPQGENTQRRVLGGLTWTSLLAFWEDGKQYVVIWCHI